MLLVFAEASSYSSVMWYYLRGVVGELFLANGMKSVIEEDLTVFLVSTT